MIERALEGDRGAAGEQRRVDDVAVADHPPDVAGRPPDVGLLEPEHPLGHGVDVDLVGTVGVDGELGLGGGAGGGQDVGRLVGLQLLIAVVALAERQELLPIEPAGL